MGGTNIIFRTSDGIIDHEVMRITSDQRVGIGTITPQSTLDVNGTITSPTITALNNAKCSNFNRYADVSNCNLSFKQLNELDLIYANLSGANLTNANLKNVSLNSTNLNNADLSYVNLNKAKLINANLTNANLNYANFNGAYLNNATLNNANLTNANLFFAIIQYADFSGAILEGTNFQFTFFSASANFTNCIGTPINFPFPNPCTPLP